MKHISRVFISQELSPNNLICLDKQTSFHLLTVLRLKPGSPVIIFNGTGGEYRGELVNIHKKTAEIRVHDFDDVNRESPIHIELLQGMARSERMDFVMQKAVELGVNSITPVWTNFSNIKIDPAKNEKRLSHWEKIILNATEQSGRCKIATLNPPQKLSEKLKTLSDFDLKLICHPNTSPIDVAALPEKKKICILIGPEGGLSPEEVETATSHGFTLLPLGPRILRTETAAIAALTYIQHRFGDL